MLFIALEGPDGSGKETQSNMLALALLSQGFSVHTVAFPDYTTPTGKDVRRYLAGEYGNPVEVSPRLTSTLYALDRFAQKDPLLRALQSGSIVIADRYNGSNLAYQGAKIENARDRRAFYDWSLQQEHGLLGLPRADLTIFLDVPTEVSLQLMKGRAMSDGHECNTPYQKRASETYKELATIFSWETITCYKNNVLRKKEEIHQDIIDIVTPALSARR